MFPEAPWNDHSPFGKTYQTASEGYIVPSVFAFHPAMLLKGTRQ
jgi:hypothetical protein